MQLDRIRRCSGDLYEFWRNAYKTLQQWEALKQYPPRLSLEITRTQNACEHLKTSVTVKGVEPELTINISAPCSGYIVLQQCNMIL